jgi:hypothetical protein
MRIKPVANEPLPKALRTNSLSERSRRVLWARAAGRCQYEGCNQSLIGDLISGAEDRNFGFVAHIVADTATGPRGDVVRSPLLSDDLSNLMLLCYVHHKLIDVDEVIAHPEDRLVSMKAAHESRIEVVSAIAPDRSSHVLRYAARIGFHETPIGYEDVSAAMLPDRYPAEGRHTIDLELRGLEHRDDGPDFWAIQLENLRSQFSRKVTERVEARAVRHISVFALAPQPLLIELGRLLGDIVPADVHQLHRDPKGWRWAEDGEPIAFQVRRPARSRGKVALILALSATVLPERIKAALGDDAEIWAIGVPNPHNDVMRRAGDLAEFRRLVRSALDAIKAQRGEHDIIQVFPALPVSAAVEFGRAWMPKADLPLMLYDQKRGYGFTEAFAIGQ